MASREGKLRRSEDMLRGALKPGEKVAAPGTFWVHHYRHRISHQARVKFAIFPECATCGNKVRFEPVAVATTDSVDWLRQDRDFEWATGSAADTPEGSTPTGQC